MRLCPRKLCLTIRRVTTYREASLLPFHSVRHGRAAHHEASSSSASDQPPLVRHRHLRGPRPGGFIAYDEAQAAQEELRGEFLKWKGLKDEEREAVGAIRPTLLSFEAEPTFTLGRRQEDLKREQAAHLTRDLRVRFRRHEGMIKEISRPVVRRTQRGGMTTYHGPGQLVLWPVLDMHSSLYPPFTVSSYAHCLEATTQRLLSTLYNIHTTTSDENPGVWLPATNKQPERKIAALGVHHRRHVTGLGTAINVDVPTAGGEDEGNPWARFEPCGLSAEGVTSLEREMKGKGAEKGKEWDLEELAGAWGRLFDEALKDVSKR